MHGATSFPSPLIDGRPAVVCGFCQRAMSWALVSDGVCSACWTRVMSGEPSTPPICTPAAHDAVKKDDRAWRALTFIGVLQMDDEPALELRNCRCGSTLGREVAAQKDAA